jgi:transcriptional regulator with XRE-family HTH domain
MTNSVIMKLEVLMNTIGEKFKALRKSSPFNQKQIAEFLHCDQSMISKIENNERNLSVNDLEKIANLFGRSLDYFTSDDSSDALNVSYRISTITTEDMDGIARVNRIALNIKDMLNLLKVESTDAK